MGLGPPGAAGGGLRRRPAVARLHARGRIRARLGRRAAGTQQVARERRHAADAGRHGPGAIADAPARRGASRSLTGGNFVCEGAPCALSKVLAGAGWWQGLRLVVRAHTEDQGCSGAGAAKRWAERPAILGALLRQQRGGRLGQLAAGGVPGLLGAADHLQGPGAGQRRIGAMCTVTVLAV